MSDEIRVKAEPRTETGKSAMKKLRAGGQLPGVVYSDGDPAHSIQLQTHDFENMLRHHASEHLIINLSIGDTAPQKVLLKDVQHHPVSGEVLHVDFHAISMTKKLHVNIGLELKGTPVGVSQQGGILDQQLRELEVECLPTDIVEVLEADVSGLSIGDTLTVGEVPLDASKYTLLTDPDQPVASVAAPRIVEEDEEGKTEGAEGEGSAEPERIGESEKEEDEEE